MLKTLTDNQKSYYRARYSGRRWIFLPRAQGERFGLAISAVGLERQEVPLELCWSFDFTAMTDYADELNEEFSSPAVAAPA